MKCQCVQCVRMKMIQSRIPVLPVLQSRQWCRKIKLISPSVQKAPSDTSDFKCQLPRFYPVIIIYSFFLFSIILWACDIARNDLSVPCHWTLIRTILVFWFIIKTDAVTYVITWFMSWWSEHVQSMLTGCYKLHGRDPWERVVNKAT